MVCPRIISENKSKLVSPVLGVLDGALKVIIGIFALVQWFYNVDTGVVDDKDFKGIKGEYN